MRRWIPALVFVVAGPLAGQTPRPDTVDVNRRMERLVIRFDHALRSPRFTASLCSADHGDLCFGGDHEDQSCRWPGCRPEESRYDAAREAASIARSNPEAGYARGQAVYWLTRNGLFIEAMALLDECDTAAWWCELLRGEVFHRAGRPSEAEGHMRRGLLGAPAAIRCRLEDVATLLPSDADRQRYDATPCPARDSLHARFWWLADPLHSAAGNDRWVEHVARRLELLLHEQLLDAKGSVHPGSHEAYVVRRGHEDSWSHPPWKRWTSRRAAAYHFVPETGVFGTLDTLAYDLPADMDDEGFTPNYEPFAPLPSQVARFRAMKSGGHAEARPASGARTAGAGDVVADSMVVALAGHLPATSALLSEGAGAATVFSDGPGEPLAVLGPAATSGRMVFRGRVPARRHVVSLEVLSPTDGAARARHLVHPLEGSEASPSALSDLLLFRPVGTGLPDTRAEAVALMAGSLEWTAGEEVGLYWEMYDLPTGSPVRVAVMLEGAEPGLMARLGRALGMADARSEGGTLSWTDAAAGGRSDIRAVTLDLPQLSPGSYRIILRVQEESFPALERSRTIRIR